ncbi:MAG TPA: hypothetical protein PK821_02605 [Victivallales bacterium]|nr:hypothetical protein [Victivallales bacterium]
MKQIFKLKDRLAGFGKFPSLCVVVLMLMGVSSFAGKYKEIYFSSPLYLKRNSEHWDKQTRLVGQLKNAPSEFKVDIYSQGRLLRTETFNNNFHIYETGWLAPGTYTFQFKAEGYDKCFIKSLKLNAGSDCVINVDFGKIAYDRNY